VLDRRAGADPQPVLEREHADQLAAEGDEEDAAALGLEALDARLGHRDADLLLEQQRAAADDDALAGRAERGDAEPRVRVGAAHRLDREPLRAHRAEDRGRERVGRGGLGAGRERQDAIAVERPEGLDRDHLRLAEQERAARALWGLNDRFLPAGSLEFFRDNMPEAPKLLLTRCGHLPQRFIAVNYYNFIYQFAAQLDAQLALVRHAALEIGDKGTRRQGDKEKF